jgi:thiazole synthase
VTRGGGGAPASRIVDAMPAAAARVRIVVNGAERDVAAPEGGLTVAALVRETGLAGKRVAVEVNGDVVPAAQHGTRVLASGDRVEVVTFVGGGDVARTDDRLRVGSHTFTSRLFVGTGKYATNEQMIEALEMSGTECVTVALRRVDLARGKGPNLLDALGDRWVLLPNTAGCYTADDAVRTCRLARELALSDLVKLEVLADPETLLPEPFETVAACRTLVAEGFTVLAYTNDDPVTARRLEEAGAAAVMPLGSPIGSGLGILNPKNVETIVARAKVPIIVDAGVGTASDVAIAMELGVAGVLLNTGIAKARDPVRMARAMRDACVAGRQAFLAGRMPRGGASASSPVAGTIEKARAS